MTAELELSSSLRISPLDAFRERAQVRAFLWSAGSERITTDKRTAAPTLQLIHELRRGRSQRVLIRVIPDGQLYRIEWPDPSDLTNLSRAKDAALQWAESRALVEDRKTNAARRLKSLNNFWWSSSVIRRKGEEA